MQAWFHPLMASVGNQAAIPAAPIPAAPDPTFANVKFLVGFNGADGATAAYPPEVGSVDVKFWGGAALETTGPKFGTAYGKAAATKVIYTDDSTDFDLGSADFTLEAWVSLTSLNVGSTLYAGGFHVASHWNSDTDERAWRLYFDKSGGANDGLWVAEFTSDGTAGTLQQTVFPDIGEPTLSTWHHVALVRSGDSVGLYYNGLRNGAFVALPASFTIHSGAVGGKIGYAKDTMERHLVGGVDEFRLTAEAIYTEAQYLVPAVEFPRAATGPVGAHVHWRVLCEEALNSTYYGIANVEFRESVGGADVATTGEAAAGADRGAGKTAVEAFDADLDGTYWGCTQASGANAWVGQQFAVAREILEISLTGRNSVYTDQMPRQFKVQYSDDGAAWTDALVVAGEANWAVSETRVYAL